MPLPSGTLDSLTPDLALTIFSHLSPQDLSATAAVSSHCCRLAHDDILWRRFMPAPPGHARRQHIREIAWRTARAVHTKAVIPSHPAVRTVQLTPTSLALTTAEARTGAEHSHLAEVQTRTLVSERPKPALSDTGADDNEDANVESPFTTDASIITLPVTPSRVVDVATAYDRCDARLFAAYITCSEFSATDCDVSVQSLCDIEKDPRAHMRPLFTARRADLTAVAVSPSRREWGHHGDATAVLGTRTGATYLLRGGRRLHDMHACRDAVTTVAMEVNHRAVVGSAGGEVVRIDTQTGHADGAFIGPCSCPVSTVCVSDNGVVIAGVAHRVAGNGHGSLAVAWDARSGGRLAAFGRTGGGGSSAVPTPPVRSVRIAGSGRRVALLTKNEVCVYELASWRCLVRVSLGGSGVAMDVDDERLAVCTEQMGEVEGRLHVLDFAKAVDKMPDQVSRFEPADGRDRDWWCPRYM